MKLLQHILFNKRSLISGLNFWITMYTRLYTVLNTSSDLYFVHDATKLHSPRYLAVDHWEQRPTCSCHEMCLCHVLSLPLIPHGSQLLKTSKDATLYVEKYGYGNIYKYMFYPFTFGCVSILPPFADDV